MKQKKKSSQWKDKLTAVAAAAAIGDIRVEIVLLLFLLLLLCNQHNYTGALVKMDFENSSSPWSSIVAAATAHFISLLKARCCASYHEASPSDGTNVERRVPKKTKVRGNTHLINAHHCYRRVFYRASFLISLCFSWHWFCFFCYYYSGYIFFFFSRSSCLNNTLNCSLSTWLRRQIAGGKWQQQQQQKEQHQEQEQQRCWYSNACINYHRGVIIIIIIIVTRTYRGIKHTCGPQRQWIFSMDTRIRVSMKQKQK